MRGVYDDAYGRYRRLFESLKPMFAEADYDELAIRSCSCWPASWPIPRRRDCSAVPIRAIVIARQPRRASRPSWSAASASGRRLAVVSDPMTHAVLGARVERAPGRRGAGHPSRACATIPMPTTRPWRGIRAATADADALIAVGSGTINDLCKYAAFQDGKPYAVFGTAPSMNGYTSVNAAITVGGPQEVAARRARRPACSSISRCWPRPRRA